MKHLSCLALLLLMAVPLTSHAQHHLETRSDVFWILVENQTLAGLQSPFDAAVIQTLDNTILLSLMYRDKMNFHRLVDPIVMLHKKNKNPEVRERALATLHVIGSDRALAYSRRALPGDRDLSRKLAMSVIEGYFTKHTLATL